MSSPAAKGNQARTEVNIPVNGVFLEGILTVPMHARG